MGCLYKKGVLVLHFAENYLFVVQDAAQGFNWSNSFKTVTWIYAKVDIAHVHKVFSLSDSSSAQYKNFENFTNLLLHDQDFDLKA